jgi:hypothetical protein
VTVEINEDSHLEACSAVPSSPSTHHFVLRTKRSHHPQRNLVSERIPAIPSPLVAGIERYSNYRAANLANWNPERREMLISTRFADVPHVHLVKMPGGDRSQLTFYPDPVIAAQFSPKSGRSFVFSKDIGGESSINFIDMT